MKKLAMLLVAGGVGMLCFAGCTVIPKKEVKNPEEMAGISTEDAQKVASAFVNQLTDAVQKDDFAKLDKSCFTEGFAKVFTDKEFQKMRTNWSANDGKLLNAVYMGELQRPLFRTYVWKFSFEKKSVAPETKGEPILFDMLCLVTVCKVDGQCKIHAFILS